MSRSRCVSCDYRYRDTYSDICLECAEKYESMRQEVISAFESGGDPVMIATSKLYDYSGHGIAESLNMGSKKLIETMIIIAHQYGLKEGRGENCD